MTVQDVLASIVRASPPLLLRFVDGFDDSTRAVQAPGLVNHPAWILGHCALTMHRCAEKIDGDGLPEDDFFTGDGRAGDASRFDTESVCFGSIPVGEAALYPTLDRAAAIFEGSAERLARTLQHATPAQLEATHTWGTHEASVADLVSRMVNHNGTHAGQLIDLRRALGMPGIF